MCGSGSIGNNAPRAMTNNDSDSVAGERAAGNGFLRYNNILIVILIQVLVLVLVLIDIVDSDGDDASIVAAKTLAAGEAVIRIVLIRIVGVIANASRFQMFVQVRLESEGFMAAGAFKVFINRMRLHMGPEIGTVGERLAAVSTPVWLLAGV